MDLANILFGIESACDAALVGYDSDGDVVLVEAPDCVCGAGYELYALDVADVVIVDVDSAVAVELPTPGLAALAPAGTSA